MGSIARVSNSAQAQGKPRCCANTAISTSRSTRFRLAAVRPHSTPFGWGCPLLRSRARIRLHASPNPCLARSDAMSGSRNASLATSTSPTHSRQVTRPSKPCATTSANGSRPRRYVTSISWRVSLALHYERCGDVTSPHRIAPLSGEMCRANQSQHSLTDRR